MGKHKESGNPVWERKRNAIMRNYRKFVNSKNEKSNFHFKNKNDGKFTKQDEKKTFFQRAMTDYERRKEAKERIKQIREAKRKEKEEALRKYAAKKRENFKKLSKKTKWGQPCMGGRMEILLEKIQKSCASETIK